MASTERSAGGDVLTDLVLATFKLNGRLLAAAERMARPAGLTAAWWQVLGAILREPDTVAGIARQMGLTRQSVQRIADLLVEKGLAEFRPNPAHRRAKLVEVTDEGLAAVGRIREAQHEWANRVAAEVGEDELRRALRTTLALIETV